MPAHPASTARGALRRLSGTSEATAFVLPLAIPLLFVHARYNPGVSVDVGGTSVDATLADLAIAAVAATAIVVGARHGPAALRPVRLPAVALVAFLGWAAVSIGIAASREPAYAAGTHAVTLLKFAWYGLLVLAVPLLVRTATDLARVLGALVLTSTAATLVGLLQFLGAVSEFEGKRPGQREPSFVGIHDFAALSGAAFVVGAVALLSATPAGARLVDRRLAVLSVVSGALGVVLSGAMTAVAGTWLALAVVVACLVRRGASRRVVAVLLVAALALGAGAALMRGTAIGRFAEFIGIRDRTAEETVGVESYAHRTLLAYIGLRIFEQRPVIGTGWQASTEEWTYGPELAAARVRFPDEPAEAFPSPEHPWGVQNAPVQTLADLGVVGGLLLVAFVAAAVVTGVRRRRSSRGAVVGLGWFLVALGVWNGVGLVAGIPLLALTVLAVGMVGSRV